MNRGDQTYLLNSEILVIVGHMLDRREKQLQKNREIEEAEALTAQTEGSVSVYQQYLTGVSLTDRLVKKSQLYHSIEIDNKIAFLMPFTNSADSAFLKLFQRSQIRLCLNQFVALASAICCQCDPTSFSEPSLWTTLPAYPFDCQWPSYNLLPKQNFAWAQTSLSISLHMMLSAIPQKISMTIFKFVLHQKMRSNPHILEEIWPTSNKNDFIDYKQRQVTMALSWCKATLRGPGTFFRKFFSVDVSSILKTRLIQLLSTHQLVFLVVTHHSISTSNLQIN